VRVTSSARVKVVVTLRGPGHTSTRRRVTLGPGSRTLNLRPHMPRAASSGRKLSLVVTVTAPDGTHKTFRRTIRVRG
jgi:hypothetical protein